MKGIDYSWSRPGGAAIAAAGFGFAMRYVPYQGDGGKGIDADELADLRANGITVGFVFESTGNRVLEGADAGKYDAQVAQKAIANLGIPINRPVYFAVDFDAQPDQMDVIDAYLAGAASVLGFGRVGVYGSWNVVDHLSNLANNKWFWYWQTYAWSGGRLHPRADLYQYSNGETLNGGSVDYCESLTEDFGQWPAPAEQQEADMTPDEITKIAQAAAEAFIGTNFRTYLDLALNGGPGQFADANGKPLPLVRDEDMVARVAALEAAQSAGGGSTANELVDGDTVTLTRVKK